MNKHKELKLKTEAQFEEILRLQGKYSYGI